MTAHDPAARAFIDRLRAELAVEVVEPSAILRVEEPFEALFQMHGPPDRITARDGVRLGSWLADGLFALDCGDHCLLFEAPLG